MELRQLFILASYWMTVIVVILFLVWVGLQFYIVFKRLRSQLTGGSSSNGGSAGSGSRRIGPKD